jgi:hypothetical protein
VLKETTMAHERWWKGPKNSCINFHQTETVLVCTCSETKVTLRPLNEFSDGRWGGSSRVNEGMGVNRPSIEALRPDHQTGKFMPHATSQEKGKEISVEGGGGGGGDRAEGV